MSVENTHRNLSPLAGDRSILPHIIVEWNSVRQQEFLKLCFEVKSLMMPLLILNIPPADVALRFAYGESSVWRCHAKRDIPFAFAQTDEFDLRSRRKSENRIVGFSLMSR